MKQRAPYPRCSIVVCDNNYQACVAFYRASVEEKVMGDLLQPTHLIVLAVVAFLLFGAKRLPELGKGLGEGLKGFKEGIRGISDPPPPPPSQNTQAPPPPPAAPAEPKQS